MFERLQPSSQAERPAEARRGGRRRGRATVFLWRRALAGQHWAHTCFEQSGWRVPRGQRSIPGSRPVRTGTRCRATGAVVVSLPTGERPTLDRPTRQSRKHALEADLISTDRLTWAASHPIGVQTGVHIMIGVQARVHGMRQTSLTDAATPLPPSEGSDNASRLADSRMQSCADRVIKALTNYNAILEEVDESMSASGATNAGRQAASRQGQGRDRWPCHRADGRLRPWLARGPRWEASRAGMQPGVLRRQFVVGTSGSREHLPRHRSPHQTPQIAGKLAFLHRDPVLAAAVLDEGRRHPKRRQLSESHSPLARAWSSLREPSRRPPACTLVPSRTHCRPASRASWCGAPVQHRVG